MTCNAWNHHPDCNCGWGGIFYPPSTGTRWNDFDRFRKPNARCPVCRAEVYFYQSPAGGRVYFDELYPPWPKHPCTDGHSSVPETGASVPDCAPSSVSDPTRRWRPLMCRSVRKGSQCTELEVATSDEVRILYGRVNKEMLDTDAPFFIRFVSKGAYEISTLQAHEKVPGEIRFIAYVRHKDLVEASRPEKKAELQPVRPVILPKKAPTDHVHLWYDETSLSNVPVTYLTRPTRKKRPKSRASQPQPRSTAKKLPGS